MIKFFIALSMLVNSAVFAQSVDGFWGINSKVRTLTSKSGLHTYNRNKKIAKRQMNEKLEIAEASCLDAGWNYTLVSTKVSKYRRSGKNSGARITCVVTCKK